MPLSEKARIEVYIPDLPNSAYRNLLDALDEEFMYTFGGATIVRNLSGSYLSTFGLRMVYTISLIYTDTSFPFEEYFGRVSRYADEIKNAAFEALQEEAVLVVALKVYHSE
ncbi:MAG: hypothetical protein M3Y56_00265 [Armatimonadota bacterium]|nr:hypothetical protein [Armatimonadota bacterium]